MRARRFVAVGLLRVSSESGDSYWGFLEGGAGVICALYLDGAYVEDVAETAGLPGLADARAILVADRYLLLNPTDGSALYVWDVQSNTVATRAAPTGYQVAGAGAIGGVVYWVEWPEQDWDGGPTTYTSTIRLMSAGYDLSGPSEVATAVVSDDFYWEWRAASPTAWFALNSSAALAERTAWDVINNEVTAGFRVRLPLSGAAGTFSDGDAFALSTINLGVPRPAGGSLFAGSGATAALALADDVAAENLPVSDWPETSEWALAGGAFDISVTSDESEAVAYGSDDGPTLIRGEIGASSGSPSKRLTVDDHPIELTSPNFMFPLT